MGRATRTQINHARKKNQKVVHDYFSTKNKQEKVISFNRLKINYLDKYDLVVCIDDTRSLDDVSLPEAGKTILLRGWRETVKFIDELEVNHPNIKTMYVSFDHYLTEVDNARFNGNDCLNEFLYLADENTDLKIDIAGHSSDHTKNQEKLNLWYRRDK